LTTSGGPNWVCDILIDNPGLLSYNFASGGATIDASIIAPKVPTALSLVDQVAEFTSNLVPAPAYAPWVTNNTFFVIWIGNTDVTLAYKQSNWSTISQQIIDSYFTQVEILYNAGGRSFMFMEIPELQSTPAMLLESAANQQAMASAITQFNDLLNDRVNTLITKLGGNQFPASALFTSFAQVVDTQAAFSVMIDNPTVYGAPNASCYDSDGVSCLWTDLWNPGQQLQSLVSVYAAEIVGVTDYQ
jgi:phospholipase/lecithinase/hemolysin